MVLGCQNLSQTYAIESQTFVLHTTSLITQAGIDKLGTSGNMMGFPGGGSSAIFGPDGRKLSDDIPEAEEGILYADLDFDKVLRAKAFIDICGHYSRPDLLWLGVDDQEKLHKRSRDVPVSYKGVEETMEKVNGGPISLRMSKCPASIE